MSRIVERIAGRYVCRSCGHPLSDQEKPHLGACGCDPINWQARPPARGLGDYVAAALKTVGITPERVSRLTGKPCGCKRRQQALNQWGRRLGIGSTAGGKDARTRHADGQGRGDLPKAS